MSYLTVEICDSRKLSSSCSLNTQVPTSCLTAGTETDFWQGDPRDIRQNRDPTWVCHGAQREMLQWSGLEGIAGLISVKHFSSFLRGEEKSRWRHGAMDGPILPNKKKVQKSPSLWGVGHQNPSPGDPPGSPTTIFAIAEGHIPCVLKNRCD